MRFVMNRVRAQVHCRAAAALVFRCVVFALLTVLSGCGPSAPTGSRPAAKGTAQEARTDVERGPVRVAVQVHPSPARLSDEPTLTLTIDYEAGVEVKKPPFGEAVGDFLIRDFRDSLPEVHGSREVIRQIYSLEPTFTGPAQIDPIVVEFVDRRARGDGKSHRIETEALTIQVLSVVDQDAPSLADLKGFDAPVAVPAAIPGWLWWLSGGLAGVGVLAILGYLRGRRRGEPVIVVSPREQAARELEALWRSDAAVRDVKRFYVELTGTVRRYIERSTGIHAPEQTTEEFLREVGRGQVFSRDERQRLKDFLESADLVKFAAHHPIFQDSEESYRRARRFIGVDVQEAAA